MCKHCLTILIISNNEQDRPNKTLPDSDALWRLFSSFFLKFNISYRIPNFISRKMIYISRKPICINRKLNCISRKTICIGRKFNCMCRKPIFKKMKKDSCPGNWVSDLWNQNSFGWIPISFVRNPPGNGIDIVSIQVFNLSY